LEQAVIPSPDDQLAFLSKLQRLFAEGDFIATYKYALLIAMSDLAVEVGRDDDSSLRLTHQSLAKKFIELYWQQTAPYGSGRGKPAVFKTVCFRGRRQASGGAPSSTGSSQADPPDVEREGTRLAFGDHQPDLSNACGVERQCTGNLAASESGTEGCKRQGQRLPSTSCGCEACLVVQAVEAVVGEQAELELLAPSAYLDHAGRGAWFASCTWAGSH
jgi:hypothetical protein